MRVTIKFFSNSKRKSHKCNINSRGSVFIGDYRLGHAPKSDISQQQPFFSMKKMKVSKISVTLLFWTKKKTEKNLFFFLKNMFFSEPLEPYCKMLLVV